MRRRALLALLLPVLIAACFQGYAPLDQDEPIDVAVQPTAGSMAGPLYVCGERLCDSLGREVLLRGVNVGSAGLVPPFAMLDDVAWLDPLFDWGLNAIRINVVWEAVEPQPGVYDQDYLARVESLVDAAAQRGLWVVIDWQSQLYGRALWGAGAPQWALPAGVEPFAGEAPHDWYLYYLRDEVIEAYGLFYADAALRQSELAAHLMLAQRLADRENVVGYELQSQPYAAPLDHAFVHGVLLNYYVDKALALRRADPDALLFFAPPHLRRACDRAALSELELPGLVLSAPYFDSDVLLNDEHDWSGGALRSALSCLWSAAHERGVPASLCAWGVRPTTTNGEALCHSAAALADRYLLHWFYWDLNPSQRLYNNEDFSLIGTNGAKRPAADVLSRPYPARVAGELCQFQFDIGQSKFYVTWRETGVDALTEIVLPAGLYPDGFKVQLGDGQSRFDQQRGRLLVCSDPEFSLHWLTLRPLR
ncbi:MAG: cellulase family glycosylhydrolase [Candidatus Alcyoniella australis]|nr:cellulase family glycosylhydrolase [Candidatus Alcyoniella australis]